MPTSKLQTLKVICEGGLNKNQNIPDLKPGEATVLQNFESALAGGYRSIDGFTKFDTTSVGGAGANGDGDIIGVATLGSKVLACRGTDIYTSTGSGWTSLSLTRTGAERYRWHKYEWDGTQNILGVDGANQAFYYDGTTVTAINHSDAPADPKYVTTFKRHVVLAGYSANEGAISLSAPGEENNWSAVDGAIEIVVGDSITGLATWREQLIIFCTDSIFKLVGSSINDFQLLPITRFLGCVAPDSIQEIGGDLLYLSQDGVRTVAGTDRIGDTEVSSISHNIRPAVIAAIQAGNTDLMSSVIVRQKSQYRLFYPTQAGAEADMQGFIGTLHRHRGRQPVDNIEGRGPAGWEWAETKGIKPNVCYSDFVGNTEYVIHGGYEDGSSEAFVFRQENGTSFNGSNIVCIFITAPMDFSDSYVRKIIHKLTFFYKVEGTVSTTCTLVYDYGDANVATPAALTITEGGVGTVYGEAVYGTNTYGTQGVPVSKHNVLGSGFQLELDFNSEHSDKAPYIIQGFDIQYGVGGRE